jgi:CheY-like chemotaxis protein
MTARILAIDDDDLQLDVYKNLLGDHGFDVTVARSEAAALPLLEHHGPWDVVLVDERLSGPNDQGSATRLLWRVLELAPDARAIVITGYAHKDLVRSAVAAGVWDYLQKDAFLPDLLPLRVAHAVEAADIRRRARLTGPQREHRLREAWQEAQNATIAAQKGRLLEETLQLLLASIPGFNEVRTNVRGMAEEFDIVVRNESVDPVLQREGSLILVECKNWSGKVDRKELTLIASKVRDRHPRATLGILIAMNGFTEGVANHTDRLPLGGGLVLCIDGNDVERWIGAGDRAAWLKDRLQAAITR